MSDPQLFGDEHVRRYVETDGEVGYTWREGAPILILAVNGRKSGKEYSTPRDVPTCATAATNMRSKNNSIQVTRRSLPGFAGHRCGDWMMPLRVIVCAPPGCFYFLNSWGNCFLSLSNFGSAFAMT